MEIKHFLHKHPLKLDEKTYYGDICNVCDQRLSGKIYGCRSCDFFLHKSCAELPREILHFFHSCPLILRTNYGFTCNACYGVGTASMYHCKQCHFSMHPACAQFTALKPESEQVHIKHFSHHHPLKLFLAIEDYELFCKICGKLCLSPACGCKECNFYLHKSCMDALPQQIKHFFHPCPLFLFTNPSYQCVACDTYCTGLTFRCGKCFLHLCVECSLLPTIKSEGPEKIQYFLHAHPLTLDEKVVSDKIFCNACEKYCFGPTYSCKRCNWFLHKSCVELPQEIESFLHLSHPLYLLNMGSRSETVRCCLCLKECCGFAFCCEECNFQVDVECAFLTPSISYQCHSHLLTVVENIHDEIKCNACNTCCFGSPAFRCAECNFVLHLQCGPLPCAIKHKCHIDPLTLKDFYIEDDDEDELYCDACEQRRDPQLCVYYCAEGCPMIVDLKCVISEIVESLRGERGDVKLRTVGRQIHSKVLSKDEVIKNARNGRVDSEFTVSFYHILHSLNMLEAKKIREAREYNKTQIEKDKASVESENEYPFACSEETFTQFLDRLVPFDWNEGIGEEVLDFTLEQDKQFVGVGDLYIHQALIPIFEDLSAKYGDLSSETKLSPRIKSIMFYFLCATLQSMRTTKVVDVTEHKIRVWLTFLNLVSHVGFKIHFIFDHLKFIARAHFSIQVQKFIDDTVVEQEQEIERISKEMEELKTKLEAEKAKLKTVKEQQEYHKTNVKQFLKGITPAMKWKPVADGLL